MTPFIRKNHLRMNTITFKKIRKNLLYLGSIVSLSTVYSQEIDTLKTQNATMEEVLITAIRNHKSTPVTFTNYSQEEFKSRNLGQDIPSLINFLPSVVTTTDAGAGVGYSSFRVRGTDASGINVTINGIPYNDSESQGTFWVNLVDMASSVESLQLQRGVGTSTNGSAAFGASLNLLTSSISPNPYGEISNSFGSYNTRKNSVKFGTGLLNDRIEIAGRFSNINSDGYIDRAWSDMKGYYLQGTYQHQNTILKAITFGGIQQTYQAWNGISKEQLDVDRTYNPSGLYTDEMGQSHFYENEIDHYKQDHYQLHWNQTWSVDWNSTMALHYTRGKGYFENMKPDADLEEYNLQSINSSGSMIENQNLVRQKWLDNDFFGFTFSSQYKKENWNWIVGGSMNRYLGDHYGKIIWAEHIPTSELTNRYYFDQSSKNQWTIYSKLSYHINAKFMLYGDLQYRNSHYKADGDDTGIVNDQFNFINPKLGITYSLNSFNSLYTSYANANREPNRSDYEAGQPKPEELHDLELGWRYHKKNTSLNINAYYMRYKNQLVLTGALNDVGAPLRSNVGDSYRAGIEIESKIQLHPKWLISPAVTWSKNRNLDYFTQWNGELIKAKNTHIAFSPDIVASNTLTYRLKDNLQFSLLSKYISDQYMGNNESYNSKLKAYSVHDFNISYAIDGKSWFKSIAFHALINNILNTEYISNGYYYTYDDTWSSPNTTTTIEGAGYYPQAKRNFLIGATIYL